MIERQAFDAARFKVLGEGISQSGIGTLSERVLHKILKHSIEPNEACHEIKHLGYVADIKNESGITEIQTRYLGKLSSKLDAFLTDTHVTVVFPLDGEKYIRIISRETGEISPRRKSPRHASVYDSFYELYNIRSYLSHPNLTVVLLFIGCEEYRYDSGKAFGRERSRVRAERIPYEIRDHVVLDTPDSYRALIPEGLPEEFSAADFNRAIGKKFNHGYSGIQILLSVGLVELSRKVGRKTLYKLK
jgi:hypothetical protein